MDLTATTISVGYASGLNAYGTTLILCLLGRAGIGDVPHDLPHLQPDPDRIGGDVRD